MENHRKILNTISDASVCWLCEPSLLAQELFYYMRGCGHFYATSDYGETRAGRIQ